MMTKHLRQPPHSERFLPMSAVTDLTSLSKASIYRKIGDGTFPVPFKIGKSRVGGSRMSLSGWPRSGTPR